MRTEDARTTKGVLFLLKPFAAAHVHESDEVEGGLLIVRYLTFLTVLCAIVMACHAEDKIATPKQETAIRQFVTAFFSEDEKAVSELCADGMSRDMATYFWVKKTIHTTDCAAVPWKGSLEIISHQRESVMNIYATVSETEEDLFVIAVDKRRFKIGVSADAKIILFNNAEPDKK
jgi:hypothetical protein